MKRTKLYKLVIAALVIINVGILVFFLAGRPGHPHPKAGDLVERLGIEGSKVDAINTLEKEHHLEKRKLMQVDRNLHEALFSKIGTDEDVTLIQDKIEGNFSKMEKMTFEFFNEVSKLCNAEQQEELTKTIHRAFRQMRKPPKK